MPVLNTKDEYALATAWVVVYGLSPVLAKSMVSSICEKRVLMG
jgi:hypothetical protein